MDVKPYVAPLIKWWWLILLAVLLAAGTSAYFIKDQSPNYASSTTLIIGRTINDPNPSGNDLYLAQQLVGLYVNMAHTEPVVEGTQKSLGMTWLPEYVVRPAGNNQFIQITVTDTIPQRAQLVAGEIARQLILLSPGGSRNGSSNDQSRQDFINEQIAIVEQQIMDTEQRIADMQVRIGGITSATELDQAQTELRTLEERQTLLRTNYANLVSSSRVVVSNTLQVLEPATLPNRPVGLPKAAIIALSGLVGLVISAGAAYFLEFLDTSVNTAEDVRKALGVDPIGYVIDMGGRGKTPLFVVDHPDTRLAEAFRNLRINLDYRGEGEPVQSLLVTSPTPGDGKTTVAINLALTMLRSGRKVILVDGDLRRPAIHQYLSLKKEPGLLDLLMGKNGSIAPYIQEWKDSGLKVITAGSGTDDFMLDAVLSPEKMDRVLGKLKSQADILIVDSPPIMISDSLAFATHTDGILLVVRPGRVQKDFIENMINSVKRAGVELLGVVLNRIPLDRLGLTDTYRYHVPYYYDSYRRRKSPKTKKATDQDVATGEDPSNS